MSWTCLTKHFQIILTVCFKLYNGWVGLTTKQNTKSAKKFQTITGTSIWMSVPLWLTTWLTLSDLWAYSHPSGQLKTEIYLHITYNKVCSVKFSSGDKCLYLLVEKCLMSSSQCPWAGLTCSLWIHIVLKLS